LAFFDQDKVYSAHQAGMDLDAVRDSVRSMSVCARMPEIELVELNHFAAYCY
jgi:hypothetical protein